MKSKLCAPGKKSRVLSACVPYIENTLAYHLQWSASTSASASVSSSVAENAFEHCSWKLRNIKSEWTFWTWLNVRKCKSCLFWISNTINVQRTKATANMPEMHFLASIYGLAPMYNIEWICHMNEIGYIKLHKHYSHFHSKKPKTEKKNRPHFLGFSVSRFLL